MYFFEQQGRFARRAREIGVSAVLSRQRAPPPQGAARAFWDALSLIVPIGRHLKQIYFIICSHLVTATLTGSTLARRRGTRGGPDTLRDSPLRARRRLQGGGGDHPTICATRATRAAAAERRRCLAAAARAAQGARERAAAAAASAAVGGERRAEDEGDERAELVLDQVGVDAGFSRVHGTRRARAEAAAARGEHLRAREEEEKGSKRGE